MSSPSSAQRCGLSVERRGPRVGRRAVVLGAAGALTVGPGPEVRTATSADAFTLYNLGSPATRTFVFAIVCSG